MEGCDFRIKLDFDHRYFLVTEIGQVLFRTRNHLGDSLHVLLCRRHPLINWKSGVIFIYKWPNNNAFSMRNRNYVLIH